MAEDITERKRAEEALVAAKTAAEEANRTKGRFLATMSHELRTPLNAIIGYSEMLEEDAVSAGKHEIAGDLRRITSAARHLLQLISDVLDLSKIEAGRIDIHNEPVALDWLIGEVTGTVSQLIADNGNTLEATCDPAIGVMVTDPTRVRQILFNLLSNAAKFTTQGAVRVRAVLAPEPPAHVLITVEDTGIGMRPAQLERIFLPFAQADGSTTRKYGGTGLGLAICREFCRLMNGSISVESEAGVGSTFTVRLPYHAGSEPAS
jgi:signal transduction histidine kinase